MSSMTAHPYTDPQPASPAADGVTLRRSMRSEWIKLRTLRSSWYTLGAAVAAMIIVGLVVAWATGSSSNFAALDMEDQVASAPLQGFRLTQLIVGVLGVLFVTGEYATGMIRSTFAAVPRRLPVLTAKAGVFSAVTLVTMTLASFATFFAAQVVLSYYGHAHSINDPGALRAVAGMGLYMTLVGLLGGALGWIVRSTAGAISALVGVLLILPVILLVVPGSFATSVGKYLPSNAGEPFTASFSNPEMLGPWTGIAVFAAWVAVALAAAVVAVRRRDT